MEPITTVSRVPSIHGYLPSSHTVRRGLPSGFRSTLDTDTPLCVPSKLPGMSRSEGDRFPEGRKTDRPVSGEHVYRRRCPVTEDFFSGYFGRLRKTMELQVLLSVSCPRYSSPRNSLRIPPPLNERRITFVSIVVHIVTLFGDEKSLSSFRRPQFRSETYLSTYPKYEDLPPETPGPRGLTPGTSVSKGLVVHLSVSVSTLSSPVLRRRRTPYRIETSLRL